MGRGQGLIEFLGGGGVVKKRESPDFRSPEVGISALRRGPRLILSIMSYMGSSTWKGYLFSGFSLYERDFTS